MLDIVFDRNCVYQTAYHVVWCPKYRKPVLTGTIPAFVQNQIQEICLKHDYRLLSLEIQPDHIHLFISFSPALSIATIVKILKGALARKLFLEFPELKKQLWGGVCGQKVGECLNRIPKIFSIIRRGLIA